MKKKFLSFMGMFVSFNAFSLNLDFKHVESADKVSSFSVYNSNYDAFVDTLYWRDEVTDGLSLYDGIANNYLNAGLSYNSGKKYVSFTFFEKVANYKAWPDNQTDLGLSCMFGHENFALQFRYFDYCYSEGRGVAMPGLFMGNVFFLDEDYKLRMAVGTDMYYCYWKSNKKDVVIPKMTFRIDYSKDSSNGVFFEYSYLPYEKGTENQTDLSDVPDTYKFNLAYGYTANLDDKISGGIRPSVSFTCNAVNPTARVNNVISEKNNFEFIFRLPFSVKYTVNENLQLFVSLLFGQYYASYDHIGYDGPGGSNYSGWVTENGLGFGVNLNVSPKYRIQIGSSFIRIQEATEDNSDYAYDSENISLSSLGKAPLAVSVQLKF